MKNTYSITEDGRQLIIVTTSKGKVVSVASIELYGGLWSF